MKHLLYSSLAVLILFSSCKKDKDDSLAENSIEATVDGTRLSFSIESAILMRDPNFDAKRLDISCISSDKKHKMILTIGNYELSGNGMQVKSYNIEMFTQDDPGTPDIDESEKESEDGLFGYATTLGNNNWLFGLWTVKGKIDVTANNATDKTISGTFEMDLKDLETQKSEHKITAGRFNNLKYMVVN